MTADSPDVGPTIGIAGAGLVGIAGAGLVGRLLAWRLLRAGLPVTLFDARGRDDLSSAGMTAAAMLSPYAELAVSDEAVFELGQASMPLWSQWIEELAQDSGQQVYYRCEGTLVVAHPQDRGSFEHFQRLLTHKLPEQERDHIHVLDADGVARLEPALAGRFHHGLWLEGEGQLANDELFAALACAIDRRGGVWHAEQPVSSLAAQQIVAGGVDHPVAVAVDARGIGAKPQLPGLRGVRGEVMTVESTDVELRRPVRLMHPRYHLYIAPRRNHRFVIGATELESEDAGPMTVRSSLELGSALYSLHPAFGEARIVRLAAALRPALDDHRPLMARRNGVWQINGLYRHGYLCAPALVQRAARGILDQLQSRPER